MKNFRRTELLNVKNKISDFRIMKKRVELIITIAGKQTRDLPLQYKHENGAGSCNIHGTSPSSAKAVDVIGSGNMDVPMSDGIQEEVVKRRW